MCTTRISTECSRVFSLLCQQVAGATIRSAMLLLIAALLATSSLPVSAATPDPVLEWIGVMNTTVLTAGTAPNVTSRVVALVSASVFDAVNGIEPRFRPLQVRPDAPDNASQRAAAIQAAYATLLHLYPAQSATLTTRLNASLMALASTEKVESIAAERVEQSPEHRCVPWSARAAGMLSSRADGCGSCSAMQSASAFALTFRSRSRSAPAAWWRSWGA